MTTSALLAGLPFAQIHHAPCGRTVRADQPRDAVRPVVPRIHSALLAAAGHCAGVVAAVAMEVGACHAWCDSCCGVVFGLVVISAIERHVLRAGNLACIVDTPAGNHADFVTLRLILPPGFRSPGWRSWNVAPKCEPLFSKISHPRASQAQPPVRRPERHTSSGSRGCAAWAGAREGLEVTEKDAP